MPVRGTREVEIESWYNKLMLACRDPKPEHMEFLRTELAKDGKRGVFKNHQERFAATVILDEKECNLSQFIIGLSESVENAEAVVNFLNGREFAAQLNSRSIVGGVMRKYPPQNPPPRLPRDSDSGRSTSSSSAPARAASVRSPALRVELTRDETERLKFLRTKIKETGGKKVFNGNAAEKEEFAKLLSRYKAQKVAESSAEDAPVLARGAKAASRPQIVTGFTRRQEEAITYGQLDVESRGLYQPKSRILTGFNPEEERAIINGVPSQRRVGSLSSSVRIARGKSVSPQDDLVVTRKKDPESDNQSMNSVLSEFDANDADRSSSTASSHEEIVARWPQYTSFAGFSNGVSVAGNSVISARPMQPLPLVFAAAGASYLAGGSSRVADGNGSQKAAPVAAPRPAASMASSVVRSGSSLTTSQEGASPDGEYAEVGTWGLRKPPAAASRLPAANGVGGASNGRRLMLKLPPPPLDEEPSPSPKKGDGRRNSSALKPKVEGLSIGGDPIVEADV